MLNANNTSSRPNKDNVPRLADGVNLLGSYDSSGLQHQRYLVQRADGQVILLSQLLYFVAAAADGDHNAGDIALQVSGPERTYTSVDIEYLIDTKLRPLGLMQDGASAPRLVPRAQPLLSLAGRRVFMPARAVNMIASVFRVLFVPPAIVAVLIALACLDAWMVATHQLTGGLDNVVLSPSMLLTVIGLLAATTLFHEWGHASGCKYGGGRPGAIGVAIYLIFPTFFTNVTDSYRLDRRGRLRTDLGGVYFNAIFIVGAEAAYALTHYAPLILVVVLTHLEMIQQMIPVVRLDGYYALADLVGVPDLFARIRPILMSVFRRGQRDPRVIELTRRTRAVVTLWVLFVVPLLIAGLGLLVMHLPHLIRQSWATTHVDWRDLRAALHHSQVAAAVLAGLSLVVTAIPTVGLTILLGRSLVRIGRTLGSWRVRRAASRRSKAGGRGEPQITGPGAIGAGSRLATGIALTAVLLGAPSLFPGQPTTRTTAMNTVFVVGHKIGLQQGRLGWQRAHLEGDNLVADNTAIAVGQCVGCLSEAVAIQIVWGTTNGTVNATNRAVAVNIGCTLCQTTALAYQFVVVSNETLSLTPVGFRLLYDLRRGLRAEVESRPSPAVLLQYTEQLAAQIQGVLATQVRPGNWPNVPTPPPGGPAGSESRPAALQPDGSRAASAAPTEPRVEVHFAEQTAGWRTQPPNKLTPSG